MKKLFEMWSSYNDDEFQQLDVVEVLEDTEENREMFINDFLDNMDVSEVKMFVMGKSNEIEMFNDGRDFDDPESYIFRIKTFSSKQKEIETIYKKELKKLQELADKANINL